MKRPGKMIREVLKSALHRPLTVRYPFVRMPMPQRFRGKLAFDPAKCIGCKICERDCPSAAIAIRKVADKKFEADIDLGRCIYCAQCVDSCPKKVLVSTGDFELAQIDRATLKLVFKGEPGTTGVETAAPAATAPAVAPVSAPAAEKAGPSAEPGKKAP